MFPEQTVFCDEAIAASPILRLSRWHRTQHRADWMNRCLKRMERSDLVFFDPDNGVETVSVPKHHANAGKYIYWDELALFWQRGHTLLVYHHLNRTMSATRQVSCLRRRFETELSGANALPLVFRRGSCRVFWLVFRNSSPGIEIAQRARLSGHRMVQTFPACRLAGR